MSGCGSGSGSGSGSGPSEREEGTRACIMDVAEGAGESRTDAKDTRMDGCRNSLSLGDSKPPKPWRGATQAVPDMNRVQLFLLSTLIFKQIFLQCQ